MNGQLSEHPLIELIREIAAKGISGRLQLQLEKVKVAVYFRSGSLAYAACNVKSFRLSSYLVQTNVITEDDLRYLGAAIKDFDLLRTLISEKRMSEAQAEELQSRQTADILRLALQWTEGTWSFDSRSHLDEEVSFKIDVHSLQLEAARRLPPKYIISRFRNPVELISPVEKQPTTDGLLQGEVFLLSCLEAPRPLNALVASSGLGQAEAHRAIYALSLVGYLQRTFWNSTFRDTSPTKPTQTPEPVTKEPEKPISETESLKVFLDSLATKTNYYEVLAVGPTASTAELKQAYYNLARKYHPDRYRSSPSALLERVESAFARITQAYDTLNDSNLRAAYDSKLDAKARAEKLADSAPKAATSQEQAATAPSEVKQEDSTLTPGQQAENQFKEGYAALELGQRNLAIGLLGAAARAVADEPRYRAYYGRALALDSSTRRIAEVELLAAIKLDPNNAEYRAILAELYKDLGFLVRARSEAERAVNLDRNNRRARDLLKSLS
jgi:hypothetical protein